MACGQKNTVHGTPIKALQPSETHRYLGLEVGSSRTGEPFKALALLIKDLVLYAFHMPKDTSTAAIYAKVSVGGMGLSFFFNIYSSSQKKID